MAANSVRIGTRGSQLALRQAEMVADHLRDAHAGLAVELVVIQTRGDQILDRALSQIGDKGLFVTEIESALLDHRIDLAVHSCKDLPSATPAGLTLAAFPPRADARDALVSRHGTGLDRLPNGARIGTSSLRRASQLRAYRADFEVADLRGNVDTRLRKAMTGEYDAIVLAAAGLQRLQLGAEVTEFLPPEVMLPAVAQGALVVECRTDDQRITQLVAAIDDWSTRVAVEGERAFLRRLEGGCQVPLAAHAALDQAGAQVRLQGLIGSVDGTEIVRGELAGPVEEAARIGTELAEELLRSGGAAILRRLSRVVAAVEAPRTVGL